MRGGGFGREGGMLCDVIDLDLDFCFFFLFLFLFERDSKCVCHWAGWLAGWLAL